MKSEIKEALANLEDKEAKIVVGDSFAIYSGGMLHLANNSYKWLTWCIKRIEELEEKVEE